MKLSLIPKFLDVFRKGAVVADPALWKKGGEALKAALIGLALCINDIGKAFGHDLHIDQPTAVAIAGVLAWIAGMFFTVATTDKLGVLPAKPEPGPAGDVPASEQGPRPDAPRSEPADTRAADPVRGNAQTTGPTGDFMP